MRDNLLFRRLLLPEPTVIGTLTSLQSITIVIVIGTRNLFLFKPTTAGLFLGGDEY